MAAIPRAPRQELSGIVLTMKEALHRRIDELTDDADVLEATRLLDQVAASRPNRRERALIDRWIEPDPRGSYRARLKGSGVPVYALVGDLDLHEGAVEEQVTKVAQAYRVPREAAFAALAYYRQNRFLVDAWIAMNAE